MKRWDVSNFATAIGGRINEQVGEAWVQLRRLSHALPPDLRDKVFDLGETLSEVYRLSDLVCGAASSRFPLEGTEPWMFEGNAHAIRLPLENASRKEILAGLLAEAL